MVKPIFLPKLERIVATFGMLPTSYKEAMTYEEQILWICKYLEETLLPALNNNAEALKELQTLFTALKDYVDNYFDNLDVQEEINNKLDAMAESGELQDIITAYLQAKGVLGFDTKNALKAAENLIDGSITRTLGNTNYLNGDGAFYRIRPLRNTDVVDDINIIALTNYPTLIAELIPNAAAETLQENIDTLEEETDEKIAEINENLADGIVVLLGDSYGILNTDGSHAWTSWGDKLAQMRGWTHGVDYFNFCTGNSGLTVENNNYYSNLSQNDSVITDKTKVKTFIIAGGYNDNYYFSGSNDDTIYDTKLQELVTYIKNNYPNAKIFMGLIGNTNALNGTGIRGIIINHALKGYAKIQNYENCCYMHNLEAIMHRYDYFITDGVHPNNAGATMIASAINSCVYGSGFKPIFETNQITFSSATINIAQIGSNLELSLTGSCYPTIPASTGLLVFETTYNIPNTTKYLRSVSDPYSRIPFLANAVCSDNTQAVIEGQLRLKSSDGTIIFELEVPSQLNGKSIGRLDFKYKPVVLPIIYF